VICKALAPGLGSTDNNLAPVRSMALEADERACLGVAHATAALRQKQPGTTRRWMATLVCRGEVQAKIIPGQKLGINHHRWGTQPHARLVEIAVDETGCQVLV